MKDRGGAQMILKGRDKRGEKRQNGASTVSDFMTHFERVGRYEKNPRSEEKEREANEVINEVSERKVIERVIKCV